MNLLCEWMITVGGLSAAAALWAAEAGNEAEDFSRRLGRAINFGNALEAPREGAWGVTLQADYFSTIRRAGFTGVRIPVRWPAHAAATAPYAIEPAFFARVDWAVSNALAQGLAVVLNTHHFDELTSRPEENRERFLALWGQIAEHYRQAPPALALELLNEPHDKLSATLWNAYLAEAIRIIRKTNPQRALVVGPAQWNSIDQLTSLELPADDRRILVTVHYYQPFAFTHQGAEWVQGSGPWLGTRWEGTDEEKRAIRRDLDSAAQWARQKKRPLFLGEFGAYSKGDMESRTRWTAFVRTEAETRGMSWAYWEFCSSFGAYDSASGQWRRPLLSALIGTNDVPPRQRSPSATR